MGEQDERRAVASAEQVRAARMRRLESLRAAARYTRTDDHLYPDEARSRLEQLKVKPHWEGIESQALQAGQWPFQPSEEDLRRQLQEVRAENAPAWCWCGCCGPLL